MCGCKSATGVHGVQAARPRMVQPALLSQIITLEIPEDWGTLCTGTGDIAIPLQVCSELKG